MVISLIIKKKMSKICKTCEKTLQLSEFSSKQTNCKKCVSERNRRAYEKRKKILEQKRLTSDKQTLSSDENMLCGKLSEFAQYLHNSNRRMEKMKDYMATCNKIFDLIKEENSDFIRYKVNLPEELLIFAEKCHEHCIDLSVAQRKLRNKEYDDVAFERTFGLTLDYVDKNIRDDLDDLIDIMGGLYAMYSFLVDENNCVIGEKPKIQRNQCDVYFESDTNEIIILNPLQLSRTEFLELIRSTLKVIPLPYAMLGYNNGGCYEQFFQYLEI